MVTALILAPIAAALVLLSLPRLRKDPPAPVPAPVPPRIAAAAPRRAEVQPSSVTTEPFAYDSGVTVEAPEENS